MDEICSDLTVLGFYNAQINYSVSISQLWEAIYPFRVLLDRYIDTPVSMHLLNNEEIVLGFLEARFPLASKDKHLYQSTTLFQHCVKNKAFIKRAVEFMHAGCFWEAP